MPRRKHAVHVTDDRAALVPGSAWWAYLRHSPGEKQDITSQRRAVAEFAAKQGVVIVRFWEDAGESGSSIEGRTAFDSMMQASRETPRPVAGVLLWNMARWARNDLESQFYRADLRLRGYAVISVGDDIPSGDIAIVMEALVDWKNRKYLEDLTKDIRRGLREIALKEVEVDGRKITGFSGGGQPPRGYRAVRVQTGTRHNGEPRYNSYWEIDPEWQGRVAQARAMFAAGESVAAIHRECALFTYYASYRDFWRNPTYTGQRRVGGTVVEGAHPAYDSAEQYAAILRRAGEYKPRDRSGTTSTANGAMLSGILVCGACSRPMYANQDQKGSFYRCAGRDSAARRRAAESGESVCSSSRATAATIDRGVVEALGEDLFSGPTLRRLVDLANARRAAGQRDVVQDRTRLTRDRKKLAREVENLVAFVAAGNASPAVSRGLAEKERGLAEVEAQLKALDVRADAEPIVLADERLEAIAAELRERLQSAQTEVVWALVRTFVGKVTLGDEQLMVEYSVDPGIFEGPMRGKCGYPRRVSNPRPAA